MKKIICLLFLTSTFIAQARTNIDSLINVLQTQKLAPAEQLELYNKICELYIYNDPKQLMIYSKKGFVLAKEEKNKTMMSNFDELTGVAYILKAGYDTALIYFEKALDIAEKIEDRNRQGSVYKYMGILNGQQGKHAVALEYFLKSLSIFESLNHKKECAILLSNIGTIHRGLKNYERAIVYKEKARVLAEETNYVDVMKGVYYDLGIIYNNKEEFDKALECEHKALEITRETGDKNFEVYILQSLTNIYNYGIKEPDKALVYAVESMRLSEMLEDTRLLFSSLAVISDVYRKLNRYNDCEAAAIRAWKIDSTNIETAANLAANITVSNILLGDKVKAKDFFMKYNALKDQYVDKFNREIVLDMDVKYDTEKKELHIAVLEKEKKLYIWLSIAVGSTLLLAFGMLFYRHRLAVQKRKLAEQQIKQLEQEKELVAARAALDAEKAEREIIARDLHDGLGAMLSVVKNNMSIMKSHSVIENKEVDHFNKALDGLDKSIVELRRVAHHIMPATLMEKGLFAALDDFCRSVPEAEFHCTEPEHRFDPEKELVLYRCAYELVSNALRHAGASQIDVHLNMDEDTVYLSVVDNGNGFDPQTAPQGMGIKNLHTRLSAFSGRMEIYSEPGKGTEANVELKL